jgi:hypothetical protein
MKVLPKTWIADKRNAANPSNFSGLNQEKMPETGIDVPANSRCFPVMAQV